MADLRGRRRSVRAGGHADSERGQILLIAAFTLAVTFVALALVVNSAIFTENLASRGEVTGSSEALTYQHQVEQGVAEAIRYANRYEYASPASSVQASVQTVQAQGVRQQAAGGQLVHVEYVRSDSGARIADNTSGGSTFLNESTPTGVADWRLASGVDRTRNVQLTVTDTAALAGGPGGAFTLEANESAASVWQLRLWRDGGDVVVDVETAGGVRNECRTPDSTPVEIDVTRGLVDGQRCHALTRSGANGDPMWWGTGLTGSYAIRIENGDRIRGNYSMIVDGAPDSDELAAGTAAGADPYETNAIYGATVEYVFRTSQVTYETEIDVRPGEPQ